MRKVWCVICCMLILPMLFAPLGFAAGDYDTLADWDLRVAVPDHTTAVLEGNEYYIYAQKEGSIPYVMIRTYGYDSEETFLADFTEYMRGRYSDLQVTADGLVRMVGNKTCRETDYSYQVSGYQVRDRRMVTVVNGRLYMFASKEIEELGMTVGSMLEDVVASCEFLSAPAASEEPEEGGLADGYLYCQNDGMPKYWLDLSGEMGSDPVLHCFFRSGDPTFYESCFQLDMKTAEITERGLEIYKIVDEYGFDHSNWFRSLVFQFYLDGAIMTADRDERTLAGGAEDNILTGTYVMIPVRVGTAYEKNRDGDLVPRTYPLPEKEGPYSAEELGRWAQIFYFRKNGFFPPEAEVTANTDGTFTIHLFEIVDLDGEAHTATSAWLTVDAYGVGTDDIMEERVDLFQN